jgi:hypothetical protein
MIIEETSIKAVSDGAFREEHDWVGEKDRRVTGLRG